MKTKRVCLIAGALMLLAAIGFVIYALNHPEASTPFRMSLGVTRIAYAAYIAVMAGCFAIAARRR